MSAGPSVDPERFRHAMGRWATGVSIVTAHHEGVDAGLTVNALLSVSLRPPTVLVSLQRDVDTLPVLRRAGGFGVSFLAADQPELSRRFAQSVPSEAKFRDGGWHRGSTGVPLIDGAVAALECRLVSMTPTFDHELVVGEVVGIEERPDAEPLLFFRGRYADVERDGRIRLGGGPG